MDHLGGGPLRPQGLSQAPTFLSQAEVKSGGLAIGAPVSQGQGLKKTLRGSLVLEEEEEEAGMDPRFP